MKTLFLSRRGFLLGAGGVGAALVLGATNARAAASFEPSVWVRIEPTGDVYITCNRSEMGQGVRSSLPALVADELGADLARVQVVQAPGDEAYGDQNTDGSTSVRTQYVMLRRVGAVARTLLLTAAAARLVVDPAELVARGNVVRHEASGRSVPFGELVAAAAALPVPDPDTVALRPDDELVYVGTDLPLIDAQAYVTGTARYGADIVLPGMVTAVVARPPVLGAAVERFDATATRAVRGVLDVIELPAWSAPGRFHPVGGVAVVATNTWAALEGRRKLQVTWTPGSHDEVSSAAEYAAMEAAVETSGSNRRTVGDADDALERAASRVGAVYRIPHLIHAPLEPPAAVVWRKEDSCEVWAPVQAPQRTRKWVSKVVGLGTDDITVHVTYLGAAFGRKSKPDFVVEAAILSERLRLPVRVQWSREDEIRHGYYHAVSVQRLDAGLSADGEVIAWRHRIASPSITTTFAPLLHGLRSFELGQGVLDLPLAVPNVAVEAHTTKEHVRIGWMRSVYNMNHAFAIQSFVDELAHARGIPTPDMLLAVLGPDRVLDENASGGKLPNYGASLQDHPIDVSRWRRVVQRVRAASGFDGSPADGSAYGFAAHRSFLSYVAVVARVSRDPRGGPRLEEVWIAMDAGQILNRDRVHAQLEGAVVFGATVALYGNITLDRGAVVQSNFRDYRLLRLSEAPHAIHIELVGGEHPPGGVGEPGVPPVAPAIANAWFALTGERQRALPFRPGVLPR